MKRGLLAVLVFAPFFAGADMLVVTPEKGEAWWGGLDSYGWALPVTDSSPAFSVDVRMSNCGNHGSPLFVSSKGRWVWNEEPFVITVKDGKLELTGDAPFETGRAAEATLRGAFKAVAAKYFPADGRVPPADFFAYPQWNTWIELQYDQNETAILRYVDGIAAHGFPKGGVVMIDDTWQTGYGLWRFEPTRFKDPKTMCAKIRAQGYRTMFWVCPFVSMDSPEFRRLEQAGGLLRDKTTGHALPMRWWNGVSAVLDLSNSVDAQWFRGELKRLTDAFGVDGFKLDAGDIEYYDTARGVPKKAGTTAADQCRLYCDLAADFPYNEYRAAWKSGGKPLVARLADKGHSWEDANRLIPDMMTAGLLGYPFVCPDMVGGGLWTAFQPGSAFDAELFVRSAQIHALAPMMQFSAAPWRVLDEKHLAAVVKAVGTRQKFAHDFVRLAAESAKTGEPMLRPLAYNWPEGGYENVRDAFAMGTDLIVAPQTKKGAKTRMVPLPSGVWKADDGSIHEGPAALTVETPLERLPYFIRIKE